MKESVDLGTSAQQRGGVLGYGFSVLVFDNKKKPT
jgi:hypothetical protein